MKYTSTVLFAGAGLMDCALASHGGRVITAVEWDDKISAQYARA
jgi:site-specific DNA-cytosine methylase